MAKFKIEKIKIKETRITKRHFWYGGFWGFVLNDDGIKQTVLKPTDKSLEYFHLINIENKETITPIAGPISRIELWEEFDFGKPTLWTA